MQGTSEAGVHKNVWVLTIELVFSPIIATRDKMDVMMHKIERRHHLVDCSSK